MLSATRSAKVSSPWMRSRLTQTGRTGTGIGAGLGSGRAGAMAGSIAGVLTSGNP